MSDRAYTLADGTTATVGDTIYEADAYCARVTLRVVARSNRFWLDMRIPLKYGTADGSRSFATRRAAIARLVADAKVRAERSRVGLASAQRQYKRAMSLLMTEDARAAVAALPSPCAPAAGRGRA